MAISQSEILRYESQASMRKSAEVIQEAKAARKQTAILSHSHKDARLAKSVQAFLHAQGWEIYIDWDDTAMPDSPNRETALLIQGKIRDLTWFLFLATQNSMQSRWCPWEIGYADGVKPYENILVIPTSDSSGSPVASICSCTGTLTRPKGAVTGLSVQTRRGLELPHFNPSEQTIKVRLHYGTPRFLQFPLQA